MSKVWGDFKVKNVRCDKWSCPALTILQIRFDFLKCWNVKSREDTEWGAMLRNNDRCPVFFPFLLINNDWMLKIKAFHLKDSGWSTMERAFVLLEIRTTSIPLLRATWKKPTYKATKYIAEINSLSQGGSPLANRYQNGAWINCSLGKPFGFIFKEHDVNHLFRNGRQGRPCETCYRPKNSRPEFCKMQNKQCD